MRRPGPGRPIPTRGAAVQNRDAPSRAWNTERIGGGARGGRMTGDHTGIGGRGTGTQISPDGACEAAGAASCARQVLPSSSPPRHQLARLRSSCYLIPPLAGTLADITTPLLRRAVFFCSTPVGCFFSPPSPQLPCRSLRSPAACAAAEPRLAPSRFTVRVLAVVHVPLPVLAVVSYIGNVEL